MAEELWARRPLPPPGPGAVSLGRWEPASLGELTAGRRRLAELLQADGRPAGIDPGAVERLLIAFEELGSNGLRHGHRPVRATVAADDRYWLLDVSDAAVDRPPVPAVDRDAAQGGLGLYLVARICGAHGWTVAADGRKHVWARIDRTRAEAPSSPWASVPRPRGPQPRRDRHR
jgi:anti-sigma regulatory factor (Ser/Thr protein kinase)